eukprot:6207245-Pleurochrysis_carterae.AAC.1
MQDDEQTMGSTRLLSGTVEADFQSAVRAAVRSDSSCVPHSTVLISMHDETQEQIRHFSLSRVSSKACLMSRFVSLCWSSVRSKRATGDNGTCVKAPPPSTVGAARYHEITWTKWLLLSIALREARLAFFIDADVVLLHNPFSALGSSARNDAMACISDGVPTEELFYQYEGPGTNPLNSGQLLTCSAEAISTILAAMPAVFDASSPLDQEVAYAALQRSKRRIDRLPSRFAGNCWFGPPQNPPWCTLTTFHAHCTGSTAEKLSRIQLVLNETAKCARTHRQAALPPAVPLDVRLRKGSSGLEVAD